MTPETLALFRDLLSQVNLNVGHPDFAAEAARFTKARAELDAALAESE